jgi:hypothetical protein
VASRGSPVPLSRFDWRGELRIGWSGCPRRVQPSASPSNQDWAAALLVEPSAGADPRLRQRPDRVERSGMARRSPAVSSASEPRGVRSGCCVRATVRTPLGDVGRRALLHGGSSPGRRRRRRGKCYRPGTSPTITSGFTPLLHLARARPVRASRRALSRSKTGSASRSGGVRQARPARSVPSTRRPRWPPGWFWRRRCADGKRASARTSN